MLLEADPIAADVRRTKRRKLIPQEAVCVLCGETDPVVLEDDHVLGVRASDTVRTWLCKNCHARQTAARYDHQGGTPAGRADQDLPFPERHARALRSLGVFAAALAVAVFLYADQLDALTAGMDAYAPGWREQEWAR